MEGTTQKGGSQDLTAPYREHKLAKKWVEQIFDPRKEWKRLERFRDCASFLAFEHCHDKSHHHTLDSANFCRDRMCNMCQWRKSLRTWSSIWKSTEHLLKTDKNKPQFILLTLTVQNCEIQDTGSTLKRMSKAFQSYRRKKFFKEKVRGYFRTLEVTFNAKSNTMHPHFHVLLHVDKSYFQGCNYIKREVWLDEWRKSYKDFNITQVDVRNIKQENEEQLKKSVCEVAKYAVKPNVFHDDKHGERKLNALRALKQHLRGVHLQQAGGSIWFSLKAVNEDLDENTMNLGDDNFIGLECPVCNEELLKSWYKWTGKEYGLRRVASLHHIWARDFKSLAPCEEHLTFNQVSHSSNPIPAIISSEMCGNRTHQSEGLFQRYRDNPSTKPQVERRAERIPPSLNRRFLLPKQYSDD